MSRTKNLIQLLDATEKKEFDLVVKSYLKIEYDYSKIVFTDGVNDTGLDIKVFDYNGKKVQFQLTTQKSKTKAELKSFEKKMFDDFEKAKENFTNYKYSNKLIFFYSKALTNNRIRNYEKAAFRDYGVDLELIEANRIAEESENIIEIQSILYKVNELDKFHAKQSLFENDQENLVYDLLTFGKPSEFKLQIIEAFILNSIFTFQSLNKSEIVEKCESKFQVGENEVFYEKLLNKLQTNKKITKTEDKKGYLLTDFEKNSLDIKIKQYELDEKIFVAKIAEILKEYNQEADLELYIIQLKELYTQNFNSDLRELLNQQDGTKLFSVIKEFLLFITKQDKTFDSPKTLAKELLQYCIESKFIQKIAASKVYCENINNLNLVNYLATQKRVFIDTSIALYALCYFYKPKASYPNYFFKITRNLIEYSNKEGIELNISERYIWEIQNHIKESFYLLPFSRIENFSKLGSSRNVFYNFYIFLIKSDSIEPDVTFDEFLDDFGFDESTSTKSTNSKINSYLEDMNILKFEFDYDYDIEETNKMFERQLARNNKFKSPFIRNNDSIMLEFLADNDTDTHPIKPIFVTWDKTFFDIQKEYFKKYPDSQEWLMLPPSKLIDTYAILKFSIDSETVTENLLALISDEFIMNTNTLIDSIKFIINPNDEVSLEYTNKLADIREKEIHDINKNIVIPPENFEGEAVIDDVVYNLTNHFREKEDESDFEVFKEIFTKKELMEEVLTTITNAVTDYYKEYKIDDKYFNSFEELIVKIKNEKSA
jgi:hypothetical protein